MTLAIFGEDYDANNLPERKHYLIKCDEEDCHYVALTRPDLAEHKRMMH